MKRYPRTQIRSRAVASFLTTALALGFVPGESSAQQAPPGSQGSPNRIRIQTNLGNPDPAPAPAPAAPPMGGPGAPNAAGASGGSPPYRGVVPGSKPGVVVPVAPGGKAAGAAGDTGTLTQFEPGVDFEPKSPNYKVAFSLEDADLPELVRVISQLTGKRFIFGGKVRNIKATVFSPQKVTVAEAYQAFLSILETNGLTVIPHGRFLKIVETAGVASQTTPMFNVAEGAPAEDRYITRMHRLGHVSADEVAAVLGKFKTKEGDIAVYGPGNLLIITDTGTNIRRMMQIVEEIDVGGAGDQIWIEPVHYATATEVAARVSELFDLKGGAAAGGKAPAGAAASSGGDLHVAKILPDDRTNSVVIVSTEKAYLRILEIIKKIDVPQSTEGEIHVFPLQHADATELSKTLNEIITGAGAAAGTSTPKPGGANAIPSGIFEGGIKVSPDKATNSIVVTSSLRDYASLRSVVDRLDLPRRQVFIEAVIMDLSIRRNDIFGVNFHAGDTFSAGSAGDGLAYGGLNPLKTILLPDPQSLQGMALGVRGPGIPGSENLLGTGLTIPAFGALINALASSGDADVLSTPHILATDNIPAEINVGENIPLQINSAGIGGLPTGAAAGLGALGSSAPPQPQRQDVGTKIKLTPHLNESNEVRLELAEEISEARDPQGQLGVVPITKRNATTTLTVADQQTVVIGGLMRNRITHSQEKIPVLGDIPVLGALFRFSRNELQKSNLILILTPYIIREQSDLRTVFERKMQERQEFLDRYFVFSDQTDYQPPRDYARTSGAVELIRQSYRGVDEKKKLDDLTRPKELRGHEPGQPLEMPATPRTGAAGGGAPGTAPPLNVNPPPRSTPAQVREIER